MNKEQALARLFSMRQMGVKLGLDNIKKLLDYLGNPQKKIKAIHIAGSNGKGSTASFTASILTEAGFKTGLYTSPHFVEFNERIRINGEKICDDYLVGFINALNDYITNEEPTFFEITTALAFKYFAEKEVDYVVLETGLGGRLDATNVVDPIASVITSISLEHTRILGDTIPKIAGEKAGIVEQDRPVFLGVMPDDAINEIKKKSAEKNSGEIFSYKDHFAIKENSAICEKYNISLYKTPLKGKYQFYNSGLAILVLKTLLPEIDDKSIFDGINNVVINSGIQGRFEKYSEEPLIIFDSAHNKEGIQALIDEIRKFRNAGRETELIFGAMADKNLNEIIPIFEGMFSKVHYTTIEYERAASAEELINITINKGLDINFSLLHEPAKYIKKFYETEKQKILLITGSIYVLGDIKAKLIKKT